ncbi:hypothetical protein KJA16_01455 [Patescibacteria group bacterium]|nr:hypothetical protein [Patescibacteria group bacterium]
MNKIIPVLVLAFLLLPMVASAQDTCHLVVDLDYIHEDCTEGADVSVDDYGACCLFNSIHVITRWLSGIIAALVGLFIIVGAFMIVTAGGVPEKVTAGRNYILYAVIGMVVFLFARAIPSIARAILGM